MDISKINFAFWGTDEFSVKVLDTLKAGGMVPKLIVTVPDKPKGRKMLLTPPLAKVWAEKENIPCIQPANFKEAHTELENHWDLFIVASYGKLMPKNIIGMPAHGTINVHPSLLPKYRGATPIESAILAGETTTGVTIFVLDEQMDHGPIVGQAELALDGTETYPILRDKLAELGAQVILEKIDDLTSGSILPQEQNHDEATYTTKIFKDDGLVNLETTDHLTIYRKFLAYITWPTTYFFIKHGGKDIRVIIKAAHLEDGLPGLANKLVIDRTLPEGKKEMDWESFRKGYLDKK